MSMLCSLIGLTPVQIRILRRTPSLVGPLLDMIGEEAAKALFEALQKQKSVAQNPAVMAQIQAAQERGAAARARLGEFGLLEEQLSIEKSWHMIHYLFTGHVEPYAAPGNALLSGEEVGVDLGYGPARLHDEVATKEFGRFLDAQNVGHLLERIDIREMTRLHVYGMPLGPDPVADYERELRDEVATYFPLLRAYVGKMSEKGNGLLIWLS